MSPEAQAVTSAVTSFKVDFTDVELKRGRPRARVDEGDYLLEVEEATVEIKKGDENKPTKSQGKMVRWILRIIDSASGAGRGYIYHNTSLQVPGKAPKDVLWSLRQFLTDLEPGKAPDQKAYTIDLTKKVGLKIGALLVDGDPFERTRMVNGELTRETTISSEIGNTYPAAKFTSLKGGAPAAAAKTPKQAEADDDEAIPAEDDDDEADDLPVEEL